MTDEEEGEEKEDETRQQEMEENSVDLRYCGCLDHRDLNHFMLSSCVLWIEMRPQLAVFMDLRTQSHEIS